MRISADFLHVWFPTLETNPFFRFTKKNKIFRTDTVIICPQASYKKYEFFFLASLISLKKGVGSAPKCHGSPTRIESNPCYFCDEEISSWEGAFGSNSCTAPPDSYELGQGEGMNSRASLFIGISNSLSNCLQLTGPTSSYRVKYLNIDVLSSAQQNYLAKLPHYS
jgi:hypothetical protein